MPGRALVSTKRVHPPPPPKDAPLDSSPRRERHLPGSLASYAPDAGAIVGVGIDTRSFAFRKDPSAAARHPCRLGPSARAPRGLSRGVPRGTALYWAGTATVPGSSRCASSGSATSRATGKLEERLLKQAEAVCVTPPSRPLFRSLTLQRRADGEVRLRHTRTTTRSSTTRSRVLR